MVNRYLFLVFCLFQTTLTSAQNGVKNFNLEEIFSSSEFTPKSINGIVPMKDGEHYTALENKDGISVIVKYEYKTGKASDTLLRQSDIQFDANVKPEAKMFTGYELSDDENKIIIMTDDERIYRNSKRSTCYVFDMKLKTSMPLSINGKQMYPKFSPDGSRIGFVRENNLFFVDLTKNKEIPVTTSGAKNEIINGASDWVYEEEFGLTRAYEWSSDGQRLAYYRFDETKVKEYSMDLYGEAYPKKDKFKYPKAGEENSVVTIYVYDIVKGSSSKIPVFKDGTVTDQYIPRIRWTLDGYTLGIERLNREQNFLELLTTDTRTGSSVIILSESTNNYIDIKNNLTFLTDKKHFLWTSEKNGYNHIYLYNLITGNMEKQITSGKWDVTAFYGVDGSTVYYQSAEVSPMERYIYSVRTDGTGKKQLGSRKGSNAAEFSGGYKYFINTNSSANSPTFITLNNTSDGKELRTIEDNAVLTKKLNEYNLVKKDFFKFKTVDGTELNGWMMKPADQEAGKKFPVLMFVYGGPGSNSVNDAWDGKNYLWYQMLCQKGYIVACVDNRGTGMRGEDFRKCTYKHLGKIETVDQIEAAKYIGSQSYVDKSRIGIWGWSYGGYMSVMCMTQGSDYFKTGISVAPLSTWKNYDSVYTERYMGSPKDNKEGYEESSPMKYADKLKGKFLLVHGTADDNVHFQNSMELVNSFVKAGKQFDVFFYPNKNHSITGGNARFHLYTRMTDFILTNL